MILERIRLAYPSLTKSQRRLANFLATQYQEAAFMTASRVAQQLTLNQATVIRFAQRLGYDGFPEMIEDVQALVHQELQAKGEEAQTEAPFEVAVSQLVEGLHRLFSHVPQTAAASALEMLAQAEMICVVGEGTSAALAGLIAQHLRLMGRRAFALESSTHELAVALQSVIPGSLLITVSLSQPSSEIARAIRIASEQGARTLSLTSSLLNPCAQASEVALACPPLEQEIVPSLTGFCLMIDALMHLLVQRDETEASLAQQHIRRLEKELRAPSP